MKQYTDKTVVHCPTLEIAYKVEEKIRNNTGFCDIAFKEYGHNMCLRINFREYSPKMFYLENRYTVISAEEYLESEIIDNYSIF